VDVAISDHEWLLAVSYRYSVSRSGKSLSGDAAQLKADS
jgi:hypothetical protein